MHSWNMKTKLQKIVAVLKLNNLWIFTLIEYYLTDSYEWVKLWADYMKIMKWIESDLLKMFKNVRGVKVLNFHTKNETFFVFPLNCIIIIFWYYYFWKMNKRINCDWPCHSLEYQHVFLLFIAAEKFNIQI